MPSNKTRSTTQAQTKQSINNKIVKDYKKGRPQRTRTQVTRLTICHKTQSYNRAWASVPSVAKLMSKIANGKIAGLDVKKYVEKLGEEGAKWHLARTLNTQIVDGDAAFKRGRFYSFNGANTVDIAYVTPNGTVYVLEAKGKHGSSKAKLGKLKGKAKGNTQGQMGYLTKTATKMSNCKTSQLKNDVGDEILNAPQGKLFYVGIQTSYNYDPNTQKATAEEPKILFETDNS